MSTLTQDRETAETSASEALTRRLAATPEVEFALLFGSRANGRPRPHSDWDVAVFLTEALDAWKRFKIRLRPSTGRASSKRSSPPR